MNLVDLTEYLVKSLVTHKEEVAVKEFPSLEDKTVTIEVLVNEADMAKVIGKNGKVVNSIRTIVQASSYLQDNKRVKLNIESF